MTSSRDAKPAELLPWTPGPWRASVNGYPSNGERELEICCVPHSTYDALEVFAPTDGGREDWLSRHREPAHDEHLANARLIAAAPDLYEAVERALRHAQNIGIDSEGSSYVNTLRRALAKARGDA